MCPPSGNEDSGFSGCPFSLAGPMAGAGGKAIASALGLGGPHKVGTARGDQHPLGGRGMATGGMGHLSQSARPREASSYVPFKPTAW